MLRLEVLDGPEAGTTSETETAPLRIGRGADRELRLPVEHVSSCHASIVLSERGYVLRDDGSTNGTRVQRGEILLEAAAGATEGVLLRDDDLISVGDPAAPVRLWVRVEEGAEPDVVAVRRADDVPRVAAAMGPGLLRELYEAQQEIASGLLTSEVLDAVAGHVFRLLPLATHVTLALGESSGPSQELSYVSVGTRVRGQAAAIDPVPITRSVFRKVVAERGAVLAADAPSEVGETASLMRAQIRSTIGVPLWERDRILGVLQVDNRANESPFALRDLDVLSLLAQSASQAFQHARVVERLRTAEERERKENHFLKRKQRDRGATFLGESPPMRELHAQLERVAHTRVTVLIQGETGTGKELVASTLHYASPRADRLFVAQNCAALPDNLLESVLFGHRRGAFTGATEDKKGLFEIADGGTLFLDEVTEMPVALQPKLLRALQEGEVRPLGDNRSRRVDVRIVAATNRDLEASVRKGEFREDLYYRLSVFPLRVPPLRERLEDVALLVDHFAARYCAEFGRNGLSFSQEVLEALQAHAWPGNVRELENEVQRLVIQANDGQVVRPDSLSPRVLGGAPPAHGMAVVDGTLRETMDHLERQILRRALDRHGGNKSATAKTLGMTREGLHKKLRGHGMT